MLTDAQAKRPLCFVIMPFGEKLASIYRVIRDVGAAAGLDARRADEEFLVGRVPEQIERFVKESSALIAEVSIPNPNVYYELGLAHGLGKPVVLLCRKGVKVPFDIDSENRVQYESERDLRRKLFPILDRISEAAVLPSTSDEQDEHARGLGIMRLAQRCGFVTREILEARMARLPEAEAHDEGLIGALLGAGEISADQAELLRQSRQWFEEHIEAVARSLTEQTWIKRLHRTVELVCWRKRSPGVEPVKRTFVDVLGETVDVFDEATYKDFITFEKFDRGTYLGRSSGVVSLQEMETDEFKCFIPKTSLEFYRSGKGHALQYEIIRKEGARLPLVVQRSLTYLNGFQVGGRQDNRQAGIVVTDPVEELILTVDLGSLALEIEQVSAQFRDADTVEEVAVRRSSDSCFYVMIRHPPRSSSLYIRWRWGKPRAGSGGQA